MYPILSRAINFCWFCFKWSLVLAVVAGGAAALHFYNRLDDTIRRQAEARIARHYPRLIVGVRSAQRVEGEGIKLYDLRLVEPAAEGPHAELICIEEAFVECPTDLTELATGELEVRRIVLRRPTLRITRRPDGTFSAAKLYPLPHSEGRPPEVVVESGTLEIFDPLKSPASSLTLRDVSLRLVPLPEGQLGGSPSVRQVQGRLIGDHVRCVEFQGWVDTIASKCEITGCVEGTEISPELRASLPDVLCHKLPTLSELRGRADWKFKLNYDPATTTSLRFEVAGRLTQGRLDDPRLPHPLTDLQATLHVDNAGFLVDNLAAHSGQAALRGTCRGSGFDSASPLMLTAEIRQLELDRPLLDVLPRVLQERWRRYWPAGKIDADVRLGYDGQRWQPDISIRCLDVSFSHYKFPYRLDHGKGALDLKDDVLKLALVAYAGNRPVSLSAEAAHPWSKPVGRLEIRADDIQVDESLIAALPERPQAVVRSLDPRGTVSLYAEFWYDEPGGPLHQHLELVPNRCSIRYQSFPYPLTNVRGRMEMVDHAWKFQNLEGDNNAAHVTCEGYLTPGPEGNELLLNLVGKDVPLEEQLRDALSPAIRPVWCDLRPRGVIDLSAVVQYLPERHQLSVGVRAEPQPGSTSIEPVQFPYRLDRLQGALLYRDGHVLLEHFKAEHGAVKVAAEGECEFQSDGQWRMHFAGLSIDRLRPDRDLIQALPERLKRTVLELNLTAPMNLRGELDFQHVGRPEEPLQMRWNLGIGLQQASLQFGDIPLNNINGDVLLSGSFNGVQVQSAGELYLDSVHYKDCLFTQVRGPIWIEDHRVLFGTSVDGRNIQAGPDVPIGQVRPLIAGVFAGTLYANGSVLLGSEPHYALAATLADANLARCAQEIAGDRRNLRGRVTATTELRGAGRSRNALSGSGTIQLSEADIYELPVMISLLKLLSIRPPDTNAFSSAAITYGVEGEHVYFDRIDFNGDAISLCGKGEMDFQMDVRLMFYARLGRGELDLPIVKQVLRSASQQIMRIDVTGPLEKPEMQKVALPGLNQAWQQLQNEMQIRRQ